MTKKTGPLRSMSEAIFGSKSARQVLLFLQTYGEGYGREIARTFKVAPLQVQNQLKKLEEAGWLVSRTAGRTRIFTWNPNNPSLQSLRAFLQTELDALPRQEIRTYYRQRRRPRKSGKPL